MSIALDLSAAAVAAAADRLRTVTRRTTVERSDRLSDELGTSVWLKREDLQVGRSYKVRGAYNLISSLSDEERRRGVVCASAGNHAQGVGFSCRALGIHGKNVVPAGTPRQKLERIVAIGGSAIELVIAGANYDEASAAALEASAATGAVLVHPFNDPRTIAGQGTVAIEVLEQCPERFGTVIVPVGGGGLIAGMALWLKERRPDLRIVGAEPAGAASMQAALAAGEPVKLRTVDTFVDGAAVGRVGDLTYRVVRDLVDDVVSVPEAAVCTEMLSLYQVEGIIAEPAGALASAAARQLRGQLEGPVVCVVSGGNNDVSRYADIVERSLVHEGLKHYFLVTFSQQPGALRQFLDSVLGTNDDITLFEYVKRNNRETGPALVGIELADKNGLGGLLTRMSASRLQFERVVPGQILSGQWELTPARSPAPPAT
jgi:threonine dehydratase